MVCESICGEFFHEFCGKKRTGSFARARWRSRVAASSKMRWARAEDASGVAARTAQKTMSSCGGDAGVMKWGDSAEALVEFECGGVAGFEALREDAAERVGEQLLGGPESDRGGSGAGALERDLAEVEILRREVGVGGVVFVEAADGGVAEEDTAATVGLQAVLVRIDDDGVGVRDGVEGGTGFGGRDLRRG